jgi:hypothetical protein
MNKQATAERKARRGARKQRPPPPQAIEGRALIDIINPAKQTLTGIHAVVDLTEEIENDRT